jgi:hypothetical protein
VKPENGSGERNKQWRNITVMKINKSIISLSIQCVANVMAGSKESYLQ